MNEGVIDELVKQRNLLAGRAAELAGLLYAAQQEIALLKKKLEEKSAPAPTVHPSGGVGAD